ncbi:MAG: Flp pilus assembly complex ATPase component TadA [Deltaproteobacteria bacterium]|nr:Flp pilus assembly complex ATPase component TadA [Deltaproteobacteria bacterium]
MIPRKKLGEILIDSGLLTESQLESALAGQKRAGLKLGQYLIQQGIVREDQLIEVLSMQLKIDKYSPERYPADPDVTGLISIDVCQKNKLVPLKRRSNLLTVAMVDPLDINALDTIEFLTNLEVEPVVCSDREMTQLIRLSFGMHTGLMEELDGVEELEINIESEAADRDRMEEIQVSSLQDQATEPPIVRLVNSIITQAVREGASDIHISPEAHVVQLRFRIDGRLYEVPAPPKAMILPIISRIKILSNMDIAVSRIPQDGRVTVRVENREINIRVSSMPTIYGENMVLRLLDMSTGVYSLDRLGMSGLDVDKIKSMIKKPYGMILSTGPTGSGKSTSLYSILKEINRPDIHIVTLEDPVEYRVEKIRQVQLNRRAGMTFASGLRSILRQDPDVIMVGEIRDAETAGIATQAALTGHRVLSTVHTNDAAGAVARLIDMEIEPFLVASVLLVSFAQRLIRTNCPYCIEPDNPPEAALAAWRLDKVENATFKRSRGCPQCMNTGYRGRTGVFEILVNDEMIHDMIVKGRTAQEITRAAKDAGILRTLRDDAADKVVRGITTLEEAASVIMV